MSWLSIWLIPVLLIFILVYLDMKKGQSLEEYVNEMDGDFEDMVFCSLMSLTPFVNIFVMLLFGVKVLYSKLKHLRK